MNKKAISELIGYVLIITMTLAMAGMVYAWLKFYVSKPLADDLCPDGVSLIISEYKCSNGMINITFKNQGRFDVEQVIVRISNSSSDSAIYPLFETKEVEGVVVEVPLVYIPFEPILESAKEQTKTLSYEKYGKITLVEIEPTKGTDKFGRPILCEKALTKVAVQC